MGMGSLILLSAVAVLVLASIAWRLTSRRHALPCPAWLRWFVELDNPFARAGRAEIILQHLDLRPGMTVLDAGCGPGRVTIPLARQLARAGQGGVVAMDIQDGMLRRAREKARAAGLDNIQFLQAGVGEGKLGSERFDRVLLVSVLGKIPDREAALLEIFTALKPGGILSVTEVIFDPHYQGRTTVLRSGSGSRHFMGTGLPAP
jgi:2-polyprenyl-3-methyl-5-hydroxy-6-metoxy-1,4-benzoquinol methylase